MGVLIATVKLIKKIVSSNTGTQQITVIIVFATLASLRKALRVVRALAMIGNKLKQFKIG